MEEKQCQYCRKSKPFSNFSLDSSRKDGHQKYCKECNKYLNRKYKERKAAKEGRTMKTYEPKQYSTVTSEELLQILRDFYDEFNRAPLTSDFENTIKYPHFKTYYRHFKYYKNENKAHTWDDILKLAGIAPIDKGDLWSAWQYIVEKAVQKLEGDCLFQYCGFSSDFKPDIYVPSKSKIIDAATSDYKDPHKMKQYKKSMLYVNTVEYWCLNKNTTPSFDFPNLKYVYSDEIIERLTAIGELELVDDIIHLYERYKGFADIYIAHRKEYIIKRLQEFNRIHGRAPKHRELLHNTDYPSATTVTTFFGTLNNALVAAGLKINKKANPKFNEETAKVDLLNFIKEHERLPKYRELGPPNTTYSQKVYNKYWGNIPNCAKALNDESINKYLEIKVDK